MQNIFKVSVRNVRGGERKMNFILSTIRGSGLDAAQTQLKFSRKLNAANVLKAIKSCMANMENNYGIHDFSNFYVKEAYVGRGMRLRRFVPRGRGRVFFVNKTFTHFTIVVGKK